MRGNITRRGKSSWRLKFDLGRDPLTGKRKIRFVTVRGRRQDAEKELTRLLTAADGGTLVNSSKVTVSEYLATWLDGAHSLSGKTVERYKQLVQGQINPHLGAVLLQKLKPAQIQEWHLAIGRAGGKDGRPLAARTVGHAHRVLHRALERAAKAEVVARNVASVIAPPKVEVTEVECLTAGQIAAVLKALEGHPLQRLVTLALGTGMRRGELLALRWQDVDLEAATVRVERSLEETKAGLRFKSPKTKHGRRTISLPPSAVDALRAQWRARIELRLALGLGKLEPAALVFATHEEAPLSPDNLSRDWGRACIRLKLPKVAFHALRHSHASALIAGGLDVLTISRRLGHGTPVVTLTTYAHLFDKTDANAAKAIEAAMRTTNEQ